VKRLIARIEIEVGDDGRVSVTVDNRTNVPIDTTGQTLSWPDETVLRLFVQLRVPGEGRTDDDSGDLLVPHEALFGSERGGAIDDVESAEEPS
jgi:hypothetical protein